MSFKYEYKGTGLKEIGDMYAGDWFMHQNNLYTVLFTGDTQHTSAFNHDACVTEEFSTQARVTPVNVAAQVTRCVL